MFKIEAMKNLIIYAISFFVLSSLSVVHAQTSNIPNSSTPYSSPTLVGLPTAYNQGANTTPTLFNYTRSFRPLVPVTDKNDSRFTLQPSSVSSYDVDVVTFYANGWGENIQTIHRAGRSYDKDLIVPTDCRSSLTQNSFLPYAISWRSKFQMNPFADQRSYYQGAFPNEGGTSYAQQKTTFITPTGYAAPDISKKVCPPGASFVGNNVGSSMMTDINDGTESVKVLVVENGIPVLGNSLYGASANEYPAGYLYVKVQTGTEGQKVVVFNRKDGLPVCKREYTGASTYLETYYLFNELHQLKYIFPPKAVEAFKAPGVNWNFTGATGTAILSNLCFKYTYDKYGNTIATYTPGKSDPDVVVLDKQFRPVLSQSALLKAQGKWYFTIYDKADRAVFTGLVTSSYSLTDWDNLIRGVTSLPGGIQGGSIYDYLINGFNGAYPASIQDCDIHQYNFYDSYAYNEITSLFNNQQPQFNTGYASEYLTGSSEYTQPLPYLLLNGKLTASKTKVLDNTSSFPNQWISSVYFYDQRGNVIQEQTRNPWNTTLWDVSTYQYNFSGQKILDILEHNAPPGSNKAITKVVKKYTYDLFNSGRIKDVQQKIDNSTWRYIYTTKYNDLGQVSQVRLGGTIETQDFLYNIRGQLKSINKDYVDGQSTAFTDKTFGADLSYDYGFTTARKDGRLSGIVWRGAGQSANKRAYGYQYDKLGRLTGAEFREYSNTAATGQPVQMAWNKNKIDFTVSNLAYDANSNILSMDQRGVGIVGGSYQPVDMDKLTYQYAANSNQLDNVTDPSGNYNLNDFTDGHTGAGDYAYDQDGNLIKDQNKGITSIQYNHLDLPQQTTITSGQTVNGITNIYDASGASLQKTVTDNTNNTTTSYLYWGPFVYKKINTGSIALQYVLHDVGRSRYNASSNTFAYDYFVTDHLGNVRTVVTAEASEGVAQEYLATHELAAANVEGLIFANLDDVRAPDPEGGLELVAKLDGSASDTRVGTALLLNVMAGDKFKVKTNSYYEGEVSPEYENTGTMVSSLISALGGTPPGGEGGEGGDENIVNRIFGHSDFVNAYDAMKEQVINNEKPRAFLNYIVFDEKFAVVKDQSGMLQTTGRPAEWSLQELPNDLEIKQNGYLLVYISNESHGTVWFDNVDITYYKGQLLEEQHYYPFGLTIKEGQNNPVPNKFLFQGNVMQDELKMNLYDFNFRQYDQQIGRFTGVDLLADNGQESWNPYHFCNNDPANFTDPTGLRAYTRPNPEVYYSDGNTWYGATYYPGADVYIIRTMPVGWSPFFNSPAAWAVSGGSGPTANGGGNLAIGGGGSGGGDGLLNMKYNGQGAAPKAPPTVTMKPASNYDYSIKEMSDKQSEDLNYIFHGNGGNIFSRWARIIQRDWNADPQTQEDIDDFTTAVLSQVGLGLARGNSIPKNQKTPFRTNLPKPVGKTVLGHYPEYVKLAEQLKARFFNIPLSVWEKMTEAERWAANVKFLDRMIQRGDDIILATSFNKARANSYFARELKYLLEKGYKPSADGMRLIKR